MNFGSVKRFGTSAAIGMAAMASWSALHKPQNNAVLENEYTSINDNADIMNDGEVMLYC